MFRNCCEADFILAWRSVRKSCRKALVRETGINRLVRRSWIDEGREIRAPRQENKMSKKKKDELLHFCSIHPKMSGKGIVK